MKKLFVYLATGLVGGLLNGVLGAGGGTVVVILLERLLKIAPHRAHATAVAVILPISMVSSFFYLRQGLLDGRATLLIAAAGTAGGFLGARLLGRIPARMVRLAFAVSMVIAGVRMLWV